MWRGLTFPVVPERMTCASVGERYLLMLLLPIG